MRPSPGSFLIIQTAFIGDVILATALVEKIHQQFPEAAIDFLLRKGNESLFKGHPFLRKVLIWDKKKSKIMHLIQLIRQVRGMKYDRVINVHRFFNSGLVTVLSGAAYTIGFDKNPLSLFFSRRVRHLIANGIHEVQRNQELIREITDQNSVNPKLYPSSEDFAAVLPYHQSAQGLVHYLCLAPASVWFTKQYPKEKWVEFIRQLPSGSFHILLLGSREDQELCEYICGETRPNEVTNLAGKLSYLESAALMKDAEMNYVNDSAPMHLASAVNAPVTAIYCSTVPEFGFGPLSDERHIVQTNEKLTCRPCGLHGYKTCPEGHFKCALTIRSEQLTTVLKS